jgi:hypothetical protein
MDAPGQVSSSLTRLSLQVRQPLLDFCLFFMVMRW